jgi:hypothetical protein
VAEIVGATGATFFINDGSIFLGIANPKWIPNTINKAKKGILKLFFML